MTRDQFISRWRTQLAGLALYGSVSEIKDGPLARASKILEIPDTVEMVLGKMYDSLHPDQPLPVKAPQAAVPTNGPPRR